MGGSYASRRAYKSAGAGKASSSKTNDGKKDESTGEGIKKYMNSGSPSGTTMKGPLKPGARSAASVTQQKSADDYYTKLASTKSSASSKSGASSGGGGERKVTRTASAAISAPKREMPSMMSKPSVPGVSKGPEKKEYSKTESKIAGELQKMKSGENTEASQARIKALQDKRRAEKMRAERKENRAERKSNRAVNKTISRISKVNNKPKK